MQFSKKSKIARHERISLMLLATDIADALINISRHVHARRQASGPVIGRRIVNSEACLPASTNHVAPCCPVRRLLLQLLLQLAGGSQLGSGGSEPASSLVAVVLWNSGVMSRRWRRRTSRTISTSPFRTKRRGRRSRRSCRGSWRTSTENCAGNTEKVRSLGAGGPLGAGEPQPAKQNLLISHWRHRTQLSCC